MKNKVIFLIMVVFGFCNLNLLRGEKILLKVPVRVFNKNGAVKNLKKENFILKINGQVRDIVEYKVLSRSAVSAKGARNFVLKFNITAYGGNFRDSISFFVNKILKGSDRLFLWTPVNVIYPVDPKLLKNRMIDYVCQKLKKDTLKIKSQRTGAKAQLVRYLNSVSADPMSALQNNTQASLNNIKLFAQNYLDEWSNFKNKFLLPDVRKYYSLASGFPGLSTCRTVIDFQQKNIFPDMARLNKVKRSIRNIISGLPAEDRSMASSIESALRIIEKSMLLGDKYQSGHIKNALLGGNIIYNVIFFANLKAKDSGAESESKDMGEILEEIVQASGGCLENTTDFNSGINNIVNHTDFYYVLTFAFNGKVENKKVELKLFGSKADLHYKENLLNYEVQNYVKTTAMPQVKIENFSCSKGSLRFSIADFVIDTQKNMGFVDIKIEVLSMHNKLVFNTGNVLRSKSNRINIKGIPLPGNLGGKYKFRMTVIDLISKKQAVIETDIKL